MNTSIFITFTQTLDTRRDTLHYVRQAVDTLYIHLLVVVYSRGDIENLYMDLMALSLPCIIVTRNARNVYRAQLNTQPGVEHVVGLDDNEYPEGSTLLWNHSHTCDGHVT